MVTAVIRQWRRRLSVCVKAGGRGGHFEHRFWVNHCLRRLLLTLRTCKLTLRKLFFVLFNVTKRLYYNVIYDFLRRNVSEDSVATRLRRGRIFNYCFTGNLLLSLSVKEFWKSVGMAKLETKVEWPLCFRTRCSSVHAIYYARRRFLRHDVSCGAD